MTRDKQILIRVSEAEKKKIEKQAVKADRKLSDWIRSEILKLCK